MTTAYPITLASGALAGLLSLLLGSLFHHALPAEISPKASTAISIAITTMQWHSPALIALSFWHQETHRLKMFYTLSLMAMITGLSVFCATLLLPNWLSISLPGRLAPIGGSLMMLGWAMILALAIKTSLSRNKQNPSGT